MRSGVRLIAFAILVLSQGAGTLHAQDLPGPREFIQQKINEGSAYDGGGDYSDAASAYYSAIVDIDDPDREAMDLRAVAELSLCADDYRLGRSQQGKQVCQMVLDNRAASETEKQLAARILARFQ